MLTQPTGWFGKEMRTVRHAQVIVFQRTFFSGGVAVLVPYFASDGLMTFEGSYKAPDNSDVLPITHRSFDNDGRF